jgi:VanZ family protein
MALPGSSSLKPLRRPRFWLGLWWLAIFSGAVVSLVPPPPMEVPAGSDKLVHFFAYGTLAVCAVQLFATRLALLRACVGLVALGIALELAQEALTDARMLDPRDAVANTLGVLVGALVVRTPLRDALLRIDRRWSRD